MLISCTVSPLTWYARCSLRSAAPQRCIKQHAVQNIIQERRLLEEIDCPFVCNLRYAFQDDENLFMVLDLMLGGDLRFHLDRTGHMAEEAVRFLVAETAVGLDYLHRKGIVHRYVYQTGDSDCIPSSAGAGRATARADT